MCCLFWWCSLTTMFKSWCSWTWALSEVKRLCPIPIQENCSPQPQSSYGTYTYDTWQQKPSRSQWTVAYPDTYFHSFNNIPMQAWHFWNQNPIAVLIQGFSLMIVFLTTACHRLSWDVTHNPKASLLCIPRVRNSYFSWWHSSGGSPILAAGLLVRFSPALFIMLDDWGQAWWLKPKWDDRGQNSQSQKETVENTWRLQRFVILLFVS